MPFVVPTPMSAPPRRPSVLTTAAGALMVQGILRGLAGALVFSLQGSPATSQLPSTVAGTSRVVGVVFLLLAAIELIAGSLVLRLSGAGRGLGLLLAGGEVLYGFKLLLDGNGTAALAIGVNLFLIYALSTTGDVFARARRR